MLFGLACLAFVGSSAEAEGPFISSLVPQAGGGWIATVGGIGASEGGLELRIDGARVDAARDAAPGVAFSIPPSVPIADGSRLELRRRGGAWAAISLAPSAKGRPEWASWTIYEVSLEMFANGDPGNDAQIRGSRHPRYAGGDLRGLLERADYLRELGVDAVLLSSPLQAGSSHGHDVESYYRVSDAVGVPADAEASLALFREVRLALAQRGIRTLVELPLLRASAAYDRERADPLGLQPRFASPRRKAERGIASTASALLAWDLDHAATREYLRQVALYWLREERVDGLRLGPAQEAPADFWGELHRVVKSARQEAFLLGDCRSAGGDGPAGPDGSAACEVTPPGRPRLFDSVLDLSLQALLREAFAGDGSLAEAELWLQRRAAIGGPGTFPTASVDDQDLARLVDRGASRDALVAAVGYLATLDGPTTILYGSESALAAGETRQGAMSDGRLPMPWSALDRDLGERVAALLRALRPHSAARSEARLPLLVEDRALVVAKLAEDETLLVGVNLGQSPREVVLETGALLPAGSDLAPVVGASPARVDAEGRLYWVLPPTATVVAGLTARPPG